MTCTSGRAWRPGPHRKRLAATPAAWRALGALAAALLAAGLLASCSSSPATEPAHPRGPLSAPGGPFLHDGNGRVVILHGVDAVYKYPPFELYPDPGQPWNLSSSDASLMQQLGFDVVRLGISWQGLEPGTVGANDPAICSPGTPRDPHQFNARIVQAYLSHVAQTVDMLGRHHIYTLLDMHQDVYNQLFRGEGMPAWAVCTGPFPPVARAGRWSANYANPAVDMAFRNFFDNDVVGDLQGEYDRVWKAVASYFRHNRWVVGYDPMNEPFTNSLLYTVGQDNETDQLLECFYTGARVPGRSVDGIQTLSCPKGVPSRGLIPTIRAADPNHLIFAEPTIYAAHRLPNYLGPMDYTNLVLNFHDYCAYRSGVTGDPTDLDACSSEELTTIERRAEERPTDASRAQPGGPAWFMSEFGATANTDLLDRLTRFADDYLLGWAYWSWKYYNDPTGSSDEALVTAQGQLQPSVSALSRTYAQAIAGTPTSMSFDPQTAAFHLTYVPNPAIHAPTVIFVPLLAHYPSGYCPSVNGAKVVSKPGAQLLELSNSGNSNDGDVDVTVTRGTCGRAGNSLTAVRSRAGAAAGRARPAEQRPATTPAGRSRRAPAGLDSLRP
jgi:endoglycosylceramidase